MVDNAEDEYDAPTGSDSEVSIGRRRFLQVAGAATAGIGAVASQAGSARAGSSGYGEGGYGKGVYGGQQAVVVETKYVGYATNTTATVCGATLDFGGAQFANCHFEWRPVDEQEWTRTAGVTRVEPGVFGTRITGLSPGTEYEFRAVAMTSEDQTRTGSIETFRTPDW